MQTMDRFIIYLAADSSSASDKRRGFVQCNEPPGAGSQTLSDLQNTIPPESTAHCQCVHVSCSCLILCGEYNTMVLNDANQNP